jgi:thiol:disulfide interchange protein DsbD
MKKLLVVFITFGFANVNAQILDPVKWTTKNEKHHNTPMLTFDGIIEKTGMCIRSLLRMVVHCH